MTDRPRPPSRPPVPVNQSWYHFEDDEDNKVVPLPTRTANPPPVVIEDGATLMSETFPALTWVVDGILPIGLAMLCGKSKIGKSWLALDLGLTVADGGKLFGQLPCRRCDVLYLALEDGRRRLQDRMRKLGIPRDMGPRNFKYSVIWRTVDKGALELLAQHLDVNPNCRLVIVDTLALVRGQPDGKRGIYQQDYDDMAAFKAFADLRGICLVLVHHVRKAPADDVFDTINGSTGIMGACDTIWILSRRREDDFGELAIVGRDLLEDGTFALRFDKESGHWQWLGKAGEHKAKSESDKVLDYLMAATEDDVSARDIAEELGMPQTHVRVACHRLKKDMKVESTARGRWRAFGAKPKAD